MPIASCLVAPITAAPVRPVALGVCRHWCEGLDGRAGLEPGFRLSTRLHAEREAPRWPTSGPASPSVGGRVLAAGRRPPDRPSGHPSGKVTGWGVPRPAGFCPAAGPPAEGTRAPSSADSGRPGNACAPRDALSRLPGFGVHTHPARGDGGRVRHRFLTLTLTLGAAARNTVRSSVGGRRRASLPGQTPACPASG